jgi:hypothetical protein
MKKLDYFDLETVIHQAWQTSEDIDLFIQQYYDGPRPMTEDEVFNVVHGIKLLNDMRMEKLFDMYRRIFELDEYASDEVKAYREKVLSNLLPTKKKRKQK